MLIGNSKVNDTSINASDIPNLTIERNQIPPEFIWFGALGPKPHIISYSSGGLGQDSMIIHLVFVPWVIVPYGIFFFLRPWPRHKKVADLWWLRPSWKPKYIETCKENVYFQSVGQYGTKKAPRSPKISSRLSSIARKGSNTAPRWSIAAPA